MPFLPVGLSTDRQAVYFPAGFARNTRLLLIQLFTDETIMNNIDVTVTGESLTRTLPDFALMAAMAIIFLTGAYFAFLRYDVR